MADADKLIEEHKRLLKVTFDRVDDDKDGQIGTSDIKKFFTMVGWQVTDADVEAMIKKADSDKSGKVSWDEWLQASLEFPPRMRMALLLCALFQEFDKDNSGFITGEDLKILCTQAGCTDISDDEVSAMIKRVDKDGDNKINFGEFSKAFLAYYEKQQAQAK